jgi:4-amino-4-deoxy-L-arabinose transferase
MAVGRCPTDHVETIFIFFIVLGVFLVVYYARHPSSIAIVSIGIVTGCAILTKWLPGLIVVAVFFTLLIQKETWKKAFLHCGTVFGVAFIIFIPWQIYIYSTFPKEAIWENYFNSSRHIFEALEGHEGTIWFHLLKIPKIYGELVYIPLFLFLYAIFKNKISRESFALVVWFVLPYLFFSFVATKMQGYVLMSAPAIFIMLSYSFIYLKEIMVGSKYRKAIVLLLILLVILPVRYSLERIRPFSDINRNPPWAQELRTLETRVGGGKSVIFNIKDYIEAMFYTKITAYPFIPNQEQIDQAISKGFKIYIYDSPDISSAIRSNTHITILEHTL